MELDVNTRKRIDETTLLTKCYINAEFSWRIKYIFHPYGQKDNFNSYCKAILIVQSKQSAFS